MEEKVLKLDKANWKATKLGDLATEISKRVDNPGKSEYDRFVSLRCFVSGDIKIKSWESTENLASSAKAFKSGDILFARRNAYLCRASLVDFDGCCSGDAFVLRENHDKVVPGYLAFLLNSDAIWDYANSNAAGTMSKRVKWRDLAEYEFLLPPKDQQAKLAELLWATDEVIQKNNSAKESVEKTKAAIQRHFFESPNDIYIAIEDMAKVYSGGTPNRKREDYWNGDIPWIKTGEVNYEEIYDTEEYISKLGLNKSATKLIPKGSVLVAMYGQGVTRGRVAITGIEATCNQACAIIETSSDNISKHIFNYLEYKYEALRSLAHGANQQNLNLRMIKEFKVPKMETSLIANYLDQFKSLKMVMKSFDQTIESSKNLQKSLINQVF